MMRLQVFGSVDLVSADGLSLHPVLVQPKRTALLCYLAVAAPRGFHRRDVIKAMFWPEHDTEQARHALRQALYFLRSAAGPGTVVSRGDELAVSPDHLECDCWDFERALHEERHEDALALYSGDLLRGLYLSGALEFERWLDMERARLRGCATTAAWAAADTREREGDLIGAAKYARRAAAFAPGDENELRRLLAYLERLGDRAGALRAYEAFVDELAREYELEPSAQTRLLADRIRDTVLPSARITVPQPMPVPQSEMVLPYRDGHRASIGAPADRGRGAPGRRRRALAFGGLFVALALGWSLISSKSPSTADRSIAVLPFRSHSDIPRERWFADVLHEQLIMELSSISSINVIARTDVQEYRNTTKPLRQIADDLNATHIVEASAVQDSGQARVTVRLYDRTGDLVWSRTFPRELGDILALQADLAVTITEEIRIRLTADEQARLSANRLVDTAAFNRYAEAFHYLDQGGIAYKVSADSAMALRHRAADLFAEATQLDPSWALAWAYRAKALHWAGSSTLSSQADSLFQLARAAAERAIGLDPDEPAGYDALGFILYRLWEWEDAEEAYRRLKRLNPNSANLGAALFYNTIGRHEDAVDEFRRARMQSPVSLLVRVHFGWALACAGQFQEALPLLDPSAFSQLGPWERSRRANALVRAQRYEQAVAEFEDFVRGGAYPPDGMAYAYAKSGNSEEAQRIVEERRRRSGELSPNSQAGLSGIGALADDLAIGDRAALIDRLEKMYNARDQYLPEIRCEPYFADLLAISEARTILERLGLPL
jgi:TolB-like protein/DNA-binding SARP family transcriptional activator/Tfp pilus assembly protein PilF